LRNYEITGTKGSDYFSKKFDNIQNKFKEKTQVHEFKIDQPNKYLPQRDKSPKFINNGKQCTLESSSETGLVIVLGESPKG